MTVQIPSVMFNLRNITNSASAVTTSGRAMRMNVVLSRSVRPHLPADRQYRAAQIAIATEIAVVAKAIFVDCTNECRISGSETAWPNHLPVTPPHVASVESLLKAFMSTAAIGRYRKTSTTDVIRASPRRRRRIQRGVTKFPQRRTTRTLLESTE